MQRFALIAITALVFPLACQADIYRCGSGESIVYQDSPCAAGREQTRILRASTTTTTQTTQLSDNNASQMLSGKEARPILPVGRTELSLGMSDDEVLNLPAWGRPKKITRNKANRVWHEEWVYASPSAGERHLRFSNGKLTAIESERVDTASLQLIAATQRY